MKRLFFLIVSMLFALSAISQVSAESDKRIGKAKDRPLRQLSVSSNEAQSLLNEASVYEKSNSLKMALGIYNQVLLADTTPNVQISLNIHAGYLSYQLGQISECIKYVKKARAKLEVNGGANSNDYWLSIYYLLATCEQALLNQKTTRSYLDSAQHYISESSNSALVVEFDELQAQYYYSSNDMPKALAYAQAAQEIAQSDPANCNYGQALLMIAKIRGARFDSKGAMEYAKDALSTFNAINNPTGQVMAYSIIGFIEWENGEIKVSLDDFNRSRTMSERTDAILPKIKANLDLATWYYYQNLLNTSIEYATKAETLCNSSEDLSLHYYVYKFMAELYMLNGNLMGAEHYAKNAFSYAKQLKYWPDIKAICQILGDISTKTNRTGLANEYYRNSILYADSVLSSLSEQEMELLQNAELLRLTQQKEMLLRQNQETVSDNQKKQSLIGRQNHIITYATCLIALAIILTLFLIRLLVQKGKANAELQEKTFKISQQKEEIEAQRKHLQDTNHELEKLSLIACETDNAIRVLDNEGNLTWINEGFSHMYGYSLDDLLMDSSLLGGVDVAEAISIWKNQETKESIEKEIGITTKWGDQLWVHQTLTPLLSSDGENHVKSIISIETNITKLKKTQDELTAANIDINASIQYACRIQNTIMPPFETLSKIYPNSFAYYRPRNIVSGDFYWIGEKHGRTIVACADSTGHGVPGAFLSLVGMLLMSKIVEELGIVQPAAILNRLRIDVIRYLHQNNNNSSAGDGMDMSIVSIDRENKILVFAGAMNPIYIFREGGIIELKPDRMPVGFYDNEDRSFSQTKVQLMSGDQIYMFSDGYYDQFGGNDNVKMKSLGFKEVLRQCVNKPKEEQMIILEEKFNEWRGSNPQVDDISVVGFEIQ